MKCKICDFEEKDPKKFSTHIFSKHKLSSLNYTIKFLYDGFRPLCPECKKETRYVAFEFKEYCKQHGKIKMSIAGKTGGSAPSWNKGKTKNTDERIMRQAIEMAGEKNHFFGKKHSEKVREKISETKKLNKNELESRISARKNEFELLTDISEYKKRQQNYLEFKCKICGHIQNKTLQAFERGSCCEKCVPIGHSKWEIEVFNWISSLKQGGKLGDRSILSPKEIDIFFEKEKLGIECHGLYFHTIDRVDKYAHSDKVKLASDRGIRLLQIFWDEWRDKRSIVESMIRYRLHLFDRKIGARNCELKEVSSKEQKSFFNNTHISGYVSSKTAFGLYYEDELVACLSLRSPRQKKWCDYLEVARFSTKLNVSVVGALSRLIEASKKYIKSFNRKGLLTYVDRRIGNGQGYIKSGFSLESVTAPDYWYTDNTCRYDRFKFRAKDGKSEQEVASESKVQRIYGAGSLILLLNI
jgi:hypothetical protein